jgi:hypothetical protein
VLSDLGITTEVYEIEADALGTSPTLAVAVQNMAGDDIEYVYPFVNAVNTAALMNEADLLGWEPTWVVSDHSERTSYLVPNNGALAQVANSIGVTATVTDPGEPLTPQAQECIDFRNAIDGAPPIEDGSPTVQYIQDTCTLVRLLETFLTAAGPNPTRASFVESVNSLGSFENMAGGDASFTSDKRGAPDAYRIVEYSDSCPGMENGCFTPVSDWIVAPS